MNLQELKSLLRSHPNKHFRMLLPHGANIPVSFHVTEVGSVCKKFIDCGGTFRETETCQLQVWVGDDDDHRLETGKALRILEKAAAFINSDTVPVEIEYEDTLISQYAIEDQRADDESVVLVLAAKHTECLARELCGVPRINTSETEKPAPMCCGGEKECR